MMPLTKKGKKVMQNMKKGEKMEKALPSPKNKVAAKDVGKVEVMKVIKGKIKK